MLNSGDNNNNNKRDRIYYQIKESESFDYKKNKLYENKLYEKLKTGITINLEWSKYRSQSH